MQTGTPGKPQTCHTPPCHGLGMCCVQISDRVGALESPTYSRGQINLLTTDSGQTTPIPASHPPRLRTDNTHSCFTPTQTQDRQHPSLLHAAQTQDKPHLSPPSLRTDNTHPCFTPAQTLPNSSLLHTIDYIDYVTGIGNAHSIYWHSVFRLRTHIYVWLQP
jgi:hypothetical protein